MGRAFKFVAVKNSGDQKVTVYQCCEGLENLHEFINKNSIEGAIDLCNMMKEEILNAIKCNVNFAIFILDKDYHLGFRKTNYNKNEYSLVIYMENEVFYGKILENGDFAF